MKGCDSEIESHHFMCFSTYHSLFLPLCTTVFADPYTPLQQQKHCSEIELLSSVCIFIKWPVNQFGSDEMFQSSSLSLGFVYIWISDCTFQKTTSSATLFETNNLNNKFTFGVLFP